MGISEGGPMSIKYAVENPHGFAGWFYSEHRSSHDPMTSQWGFQIRLDGLAESWGRGNGRHILFPSISAETIDDETIAGSENYLQTRDR